ncbi:hypothetical protein GCK32_018346, partial [Trichostrongylus colubriformis]
MKMALKRKDCTALVGDVIYPGDAYMRDVWLKISKVYGTVTVDDNYEHDLGMLKNLTIDGWLPRVVRIVNNRQLRHIDELLKTKVTGPEPHFWFHNNTSFCHPVNVIKKIEAKVKTKLSWDDKCLKQCAGGIVNAKYLNELHKLCNRISGNLIITDLRGLPPGIDKLEQIEKIDGQLIVKKNSAVKDLSFLSNLKEINNPSKK